MEVRGLNGYLQYITEKKKEKVIAILEAKNRNLTEPDVIVWVPLSNKASQIQTAKSPHKWIIGIKGHSDAHPTYLSLWAITHITYIPLKHFIQQVSGNSK